ncbi:hypothetical protein MSAN_01312300 [Mycena sanguinolenta]|uniref:Uncharacterized protein n=1 Tax=Mycena sanguinolenta TaxID=230812 RepID=A0A8H7D312_9AGAR|nr:hypothetical protein MSAN_01312300 [Mycena sanguinolenta]
MVDTTPSKRGYSGTPPPSPLPRGADKPQLRLLRRYMIRDIASPTGIPPPLRDHRFWRIGATSTGRDTIKFSLCLTNPDYKLSADDVNYIVEESLPFICYACTQLDLNISLPADIAYFFHGLGRLLNLSKTKPTNEWLFLLGIQMSSEFVLYPPDIRPLAYGEDDAPSTEDLKNTPPLFLENPFYEPPLKRPRIGSPPSSTAGSSMIGSKPPFGPKKIVRVVEDNKPEA